MSDPEIITDGYGTPMFKKPIYQCDLVDDIYDMNILSNGLKEKYLIQTTLW